MCVGIESLAEVMIPPVECVASRPAYIRMPFGSADQ